MFTIERASRRAEEAIGGNRADRGLTVNESAKTIQDAADEIGTDGYLGGIRPGDNAILQLNAIDLLQRHGEYMSIAKTDHLGTHTAPRRSDHLAAVADSHGGTTGDHQQSH
jgi:hypothetical protein